MENIYTSHVAARAHRAAGRVDGSLQPTFVVSRQSAASSMLIIAVLLFYCVIHTLSVKHACTEIFISTALPLCRTCLVKATRLPKYLSPSVLLFHGITSTRFQYTCTDTLIYITSLPLSTLYKDEDSENNRKLSRS